MNVLPVILGVALMLCGVGFVIYGAFDIHPGLGMCVVGGMVTSFGGWLCAPVMQ